MRDEGWTAEPSGFNYNDNKIKVGGSCRTNGREKERVLLVGKPGAKRPLGRPRRTWVDNIRMDLGEVGWGDVDWIG
jgi:hypothetical protein